MESENRQNIKFRAGCLYNYRAIVAFRRPLSYKQMDRGKKLSSSSSSSYKRNFDKFSPINLMSGGFWLVRAKNDTAFARSRTIVKKLTQEFGGSKSLCTLLHIGIQIRYTKLGTYSTLYLLPIILEITFICHCIKVLL